MKRATVIALALLCAACVGQVPKSYTWESVDCHYQRGLDGMDRNEVHASCDLKGRADMRDPSIVDLVP